MQVYWKRTKTIPKITRQMLMPMKADSNKLTVRIRMQQKHYLNEKTFVYYIICNLIILYTNKIKTLFFFFVVWQYKFIFDNLNNKYIYII